jgi:hypothetical protein
MSLNTAITTISDSNSGRFAVGSDGVDANAVALYFAAEVGAADQALNFYTFRMYPWPRATISQIFLATYYKSASNTVTTADASLIQDNSFCFGCLGSDSPVLTASSSDIPYMLITLGEMKHIRAISIVGDYVYPEWI